MRKIRITVAATLVASSIMFSSCIGSFGLSQKVLDWNKTLGDKVVNELVFVAMCVVPVYGVTLLTDMLVLNSIEFWGGENPLANTGKVKEVKGKNGTVLVKNTTTGYEITSKESNETVELVFDSVDQSWSVSNGVESEELLRFIGNNKALVAVAPGKSAEVSLNAK